MAKKRESAAVYFPGEKEVKVGVVELAGANAMDGARIVRLCIAAKSYGFSAEQALELADLLREMGEKLQELESDRDSRGPDED